MHSDYSSIRNRFPNKCMWPQWETVDTAHRCLMSALCPPGLSHNHIFEAYYIKFACDFWPLRLRGRMPEPGPELDMSKLAK